MSSNQTPRSCGECTACCNGWLRTTIDGCDLSPGNPCKHITPKGCGIYSVRPEDPCAIFSCGWLLNLSMPDRLQPNIAKVIIKPGAIWERPSLNIPVHVATAVGPRIPGKTIQWMRAYAREENCQFICHEHVREGKTYTGVLKRFGIGSPEFEQDVANWSAAGHAFYVTHSKSKLIVSDKKS